MTNQLNSEADTQALTSLELWTGAINGTPQEIKIEDTTVTLVSSLDVGVLPAINIRFPDESGRTCTVRIVDADFLDRAFVTTSSISINGGSVNKYVVSAGDRLAFIDSLGGYDLYGDLITNGLQAIANKKGGPVTHKVRACCNTKLFEMYKSLAYLDRGLDTFPDQHFMVRTYWPKY